jgi:hypothetical protein
MSRQVILPRSELRVTKLPSHRARLRASFYFVEIVHIEDSLIQNRGRIIFMDMLYDVCKGRKNCTYFIESESSSRLGRGLLYINPGSWLFVREDLNCPKKCDHLSKGFESMSHEAMLLSCQYQMGPRLLKNQLIQSLYL